MRRLVFLVGTALTVAAAVVTADWALAAQVNGPQSGPSVSPIAHTAEILKIAIEVAGVAIIVVGSLIAAGIFLRIGYREADWSQAYSDLRANLGRAILLGLELLVAADIIGTVAAPLDMNNIAALGLIVLIRTFLSFSLEVEIKGHWPWQESRIRETAAEKPRTLQ